VQQDKDLFAEKVSRTIAQLQHESYQAMAAEITVKRLAWLDRVLPGLPAQTIWTPQQAFELLFFAQMGLEPGDLPVVSESPTEIVWLSTNRCPLLDACLALGLDTRRVCRPVNEKATQAFLSRLDPQLRFHRSYREIRPHAPFCRERIMRLDFAAYLRLAEREAHGGQGAIVVLEGRVIGRACDEDSGHAGALALRRAMQATGDADLCGAILFTTNEPCPACASLAAEANLTTIVYGAARAQADASPQPGVRETISRSACAIEIIGPLPLEE